MAAPMVTSTVTLRSGEKHEFSHQITSNGDAISHAKLRESIQAIQKDVNEYLTVQVDLEKGLKNMKNSSKGDTAEGGDEVEDDDEDEDEVGTNGQGQGDQEPPSKKPKK